ncbi:hypothetical protein ABDI30_17555 [Paenibacillus cisolokensis]|uniref:hypothetical protein n=1 Tax=Paenibacillus cisolokensis TaxID=1658519 RepID=UPI003D279EA8
MQKMYPAVVNSPKTELVTDIAATDIEIEVSDASVLLAPEGLAVIGNGEGAETIKYSDVDGNVLKECIRGFQGTAKQWAAGTRLARNFTAYDHDTFMANIEQHDEAITDLEDRLDSVKTDALTLQPGLQAVSAAKGARFNLGQIEGKMEINGQGRIGLIGVENPYVIRYGENLLPPFYEWSVQASKAIINGPYSISVTTDNVDAASASGPLPAVGGMEYTLSVARVGDVEIGLSFHDPDGVELQTSGYVNTSNLTLKSPMETASVQVHINAPSTPDTYQFNNFMLTLGSEPKPFKPREDSMLAFQTELHANPDDGSDPDVLFEREGQYFKLAKWKGNALDGALTYVVLNNYTGFKRVAVPVGQLPLPLTPQKYWATKYQGSLLSLIDTSTRADAVDYSDTHGWLLSISNADSGWGDNYTPTADEIKAYFMGYQMGYLNGSAFAAPYNGTGTKVWRAIVGDTGSGSSTLPTSPSSVAIAAGWVPYQLVYQLASPTVEPVVFEGCLTLIEGDNQVEVGTGIVLRERANPKLNPLGIAYEINRTTADGSQLKNKVQNIIGLYEDSRPFTAQIISDTTAYGNYRISINPASKYKPSAAYSVTYTKLDKSPIQPIIGTLAANEKAQISDLTTGVAEALQRVSVVEQKKAEKDSPGWIAPTFLNGASQYPDLSFGEVGYRLTPDGMLQFRGLLRTAAIGTAFYLPAGYRPAWGVIVILPEGRAGSEVRINTDGSVYVNGAHDWLSLSAIPPIPVKG